MESALRRRPELRSRALGLAPEHVQPEYLRPASAARISSISEVRVRLQIEPTPTRSIRASSTPAASNMSTWRR